jgi:predicted alpha/beta-fold hydrolase
MKLFIIGFIFLYLGAAFYLYITQDSKIFRPDLIETDEPVVLENTKQISFRVEDDVTLDGVYKKSENENVPLIIYFGGNSDDATRILLHVKSLKSFDIVAFNYRGFVKSTGKPSQTALFSDALKIYDKYGKNRKVILVGRSLGTGVATYLASKRDIKGLILITPYDSIASIGQKMYPFLPVKLLSKHKFESVKYMLDVKAPVGLIEVENDETIAKYHFDKLKEKVQNLALHVELKNTTHGDVLNHPDFEKTIKQMIKDFDVNR